MPEGRGFRNAILMKQYSEKLYGKGNSMELTVGITEARKRFSELLDRVQYQGDSVIVLKYGKPAAVLVPIALYERWKAMESRDKTAPEQP